MTAIGGQSYHCSWLPSKGLFFSPWGRVFWNKFKNIVVVVGLVETEENHGIALSRLHEAGDSLWKTCR